MSVELLLLTYILGLEIYPVGPKPAMLGDLFTPKCPWRL